MRVRPRRNGRQVQISMIVFEGSFMNGATEVISTNGTRREIGYNYAIRNNQRVANTARFEAPEMDGMTNPVIRYHWVSVGDTESEAESVLQYALFDADSNPEGAEILRKLEQGIASSPETDLSELSQDYTVLSRRGRTTAQWYRLDSV